MLVIQKLGFFLKPGFICWIGNDHRTKLPSYILLPYAKAWLYYYYPSCKYGYHLFSCSCAKAREESRQIVRALQRRSGS